MYERGSNPRVRSRTPTALRGQAAVGELQRRLEKDGAGAAVRPWPPRLADADVWTGAGGERATQHGALLCAAAAM
jgi:hypothetical protein